MKLKLFGCKKDVIVLGYEHQPDWFRESFDASKQFLHQRNVLYTALLAIGKE